MKIEKQLHVSCQGEKSGTGISKTFTQFRERGTLLTTNDIWVALRKGCNHRIVLS